MAWVAVVGGVATLGTAYLKSQGSGSAGGDGSGFMGAAGPSLSDASAKTYGTTIGDDGWSINFGSGSQMAAPVKTTSASYSDPMTATTTNPLTGMRQQYAAVPDASFGGSPIAAGIDSQTLLLLGAVGLVLLRK